MGSQLFTDPQDMGPMGSQVGVHAQWDSEVRAALDAVAADLAPLSGTPPVDRGRFPPQKEAISVTRIGDLASLVAIGRAVAVLVDRVSELSVQVAALQSAAKSSGKRGN